MEQRYLVYFFISLCMVMGLEAQEIKQFSLQDFDLRGNVKTCQVITDYGQEIFDFDILGRLVQVTTKYNEEDKDVTTYKYLDGYLMEKRSESYKDNTLDLASSMAYIYEIDSTEHKIIREQIISYDKEFVELQEYHFNEEDQIVRIITSHENAVDETLVELTNYKVETTKTYFENGVIQKSVRESRKKSKNNQELQILLTKNYLDGEPDKAVEKVYDAGRNLLSEEIFEYGSGEGEFVSQEKHTFTYDAEGSLSKEIIKRGNTVFEKGYIFQFDNNEEKNWVKKIVTPDNTYTTRKITYYPKTVAEEGSPDN